MVMSIKQFDSNGANDLITLIHNAIPHMFSNVKLSIGNRVVENINQIGHVSSMIYDVLYNRSKKNCDGLNFMWYLDTDTTASFSFPF